MIKRKLPPTLSDLQNENAYLKKLVQQLKLQISQAHAKAAKFEAKHLSALARIEALEKEKPIRKYDTLSNIELAHKIIYILKRAGIEFHGVSIPKNKKIPQQGVHRMRKRPRPGELIRSVE